MSKPSRITTVSTKTDGTIEVCNGVLMGAGYIGKKGELDFDVLNTAINGPSSSVLLPRNLLYISADHTAMLIYDEPGTKTIKFEFGQQDTQGLKSVPMTFRFPDLVYGVVKGAGNNYHVTNVFATDHCYEGVFPMGFPNIFKTSNVCANFAVEYDATGLTLGEQVDRAIDQFWSSTFNIEVKDYTVSPFIGYFEPKGFNGDRVAEFMDLLNDYPDLFSDYLDGQGVNYTNIVNKYYNANYIELAHHNPNISLGYPLFDQTAWNMLAPLLVWNMISLIPDEDVVVSYIRKAFEVGYLNAKISRARTLKYLNAQNPLNTNIISPHENVNRLFNTLNVATKDEILQMD